MSKQYYVIPIRNTVILPGTQIPLRIARSQSIKVLEKIKDSDKLFLALSQKDNLDDIKSDVSPEQVHTVGTLCKIDKIQGNSEDGFQIVVRGLYRFRSEQVRLQDGLIQSSGEEAVDKVDADHMTFQAILKSLKELADGILDLLPGAHKELYQVIDNINDLSYFMNLCITHLNFDRHEKQKLIEIDGIKDRGLLLLTLMKEFKESLEVQAQIRDKVSSRLGKQQRESILREQLNSIREELGEGSQQNDRDKLRHKIQGSGMPEQVLQVANEELKRLESMGNQSPESHMIRNYLELLVALPWKSDPVTTSEKIDMELSKQILNSDHFGLDKVKKRILQFLAVSKLRNSTKGQILLLVGPPGVGKTSLGESIAKAMNRKFVRVSLGGVRDESEIRGHRRTYIGSMPGRIIQGIKRAGAKNPVFLLDEIDKMTRAFSGDPAAAMLEVLDPEQNSTFLDHYLDVNYDLSEVTFIATANSLDGIPGPLLDRMEVIDLNGYTTSEKVHIATNHLIPKIWKDHNIELSQLKISTEMLSHLISAYTREAGVRDLQRKLITICQGFAEKVLSKKEQNQETSIEVSLNDLLEVLGPEKFSSEKAEQINPPGVVTGLAWTPVGGEILLIEANAMPGSGHLMLTGQLGDVMKESAQISLSLVRSRLSHLIPDFEFKTKDIHLHVPAGAIPKDGPSAGITMLTTIASLLLDRKVSPKLAMTGEITLTGNVLPVGGIKEKLIAAHRAGIKDVILCHKNQKDLSEIPEEVKSDLNLHFVRSASEVLQIALSVSPPSSETSNESGVGSNSIPVLN